MICFGPLTDQQQGKHLYRNCAEATVDIRAAGLPIHLPLGVLLRCRQSASPFPRSAALGVLGRRGERFVQAGVFSQSRHDLDPSAVGRRIQTGPDHGPHRVSPVESSQNRGLRGGVGLAEHVHREGRFGAKRFADGELALAKIQPRRQRPIGPRPARQQVAQHHPIVSPHRGRAVGTAALDSWNVHVPHTSALARCCFVSSIASG